MSDPTIYVPSYSFSGWQASNPSKPLPAPQIDNELANVSFSLTETINALKDIRRSDGALKNGIVNVDSLSAGLTLGFTLKGGWTLGAHYIVGDGVFYGGKCYRCQVVNDATNANRPDVDSVTWTFLYSTTDLAGAMSIATYDPTGIGANVFARANHTGTQAQSTIVDLVADLAAKADAAATTSALAALTSALSTKLDIVQPFATLASAATTDLSTVSSQNVTITGTTTITSFGTAAAGTFRRLRFSAALTLTYNATSLILPGAGNILIAANDEIEAVSLGSGNWYVGNYQRAGALRRAYVTYNGTLAAGSMIQRSEGVASMTDNGTGDQTINFTAAFPDTNYVIQATGTYFVSINSKTVNSCRLQTFNSGGSLTDSPVVDVAIWR